MNTYAKVLAITKNYLGPAAEPFLAKQCVLVKIAPADLTSANLKYLVNMLEIAAYRLMSTDRAAEMGKKLLAC
jgi:hypothetical protein